MELLNCDLPGLTKVRSGKVREIFDLGDSLLFVATDRISAFDCILPNPIPHKGEVLTQLSSFWFRRFPFVENHVISANFDEFPAELQPFAAQLRGRSMIVKKSEPLPVECVARGYLAGSGWQEYRKKGTVGGHKLSAGLMNAQQLPHPLFTPARKAESGHDENITWEQCCEILGEEISTQVRDLTLQIYEEGRAYAATRGIIVADTKFEFGMLDGRVILIDEVMTPDSSRFWPADRYETGDNPPSFDKQFVRDYLDALDWDKTPPAPKLPAGVIERTSEKYREAYERLTGRPLDASAD
ncbi:MAG: phosphoribosylaminoimidazolesuccinocarboxamide synthase [Chthoniobacteraceae bacterium]